MKPFVPLPPRIVIISNDDICATVAALSFIVMIGGILMGMLP